jgi:hypothetical protein
MPAEIGMAHEGQIIDVGLGGARLEHRTLLRPGQPCVVRLTLNGRVVVLRSRVIWSRVLDGRAGRRCGDDLVFHSGLAFDSMPRGPQAALAAVIGDSRANEN